MRILTWDPSLRNVGWATLTPTRVDAGSYKPAGEFDYQIFRNFERFFVEKIRQYQDTDEPVSAIAIERIQPGGGQRKVPAKDMVGGFVMQDTTNLRAQSMLYGMRAIAMAKVAILIERDPTFGFFLPSVQEWRASFYGKIDGKAVRPPPECNTHSKRSKWWKDKAIEQCRALRIHVPDADAAEAVGIAIWTRARLKEGRNQQGALL